MHRFVFLFALVLTACVSGPMPAVSTATPNKAVVLTLPALLENPQDWVGRKVTLISPITSRDQQAVLVPGFRVTGAQTQPLDDPARSAWLVPSLTQAQHSALANGIGYVKLRGALSPPGGYGTNARYVYQFTLDSYAVLEPQPTILSNLVGSGKALNAVLVQVPGTLLATNTSAILVERVTSGGVPDNTANQVKLRLLPDLTVLAELTASGNARYGATEVVGWWQDGTLTPFVVLLAHNAVVPTPLQR